MTVFYSPGTGYFYDDQVSTHIPKDVLEIDAEKRDTLLAQVSEGRYLACGPQGLPVLMDAPAQSQEELAEIERYWRSLQLAMTDGVVTRHRDELEDGSETNLSTDQYAQLQAYRRALRSWPETGEFPLSVHRPVAPDWLIDQVQ